MKPKEIESIAIRLNKRIEKVNGGPHFGTCHLIAHLMAKILISKNVQAKTVTGHLELLDKNEKKVFYSNKNPQSKRNVGYYHTWCEAIINDRKILIDPSLGYNIEFLRKSFKYKINPKIPDILITDKFNTYYYRYLEDERLRSQSDAELFKIPKSIIEKIENQN